MEENIKFPLKLDDSFPVTVGQFGGSQPFEYNNGMLLMVDECLFDDLECPCDPENLECECSEESQSLFSENELYKKGFPFYKPLKAEVTPKFFYWENFTPEHYCNFDKVIIMPKISENLWDRQTNEICFQLLRDAYEYSKARNFTNKQGLALLEMFYRMFQYFMISPILSRKEFFKFFRETLLLYAVNDAPESLRIFTPMECFGIAYKFSTLFDRNFDLLRTVVSPNFIITIDVEQ